RNSHRRDAMLLQRERRVSIELSVSLPYEEIMGNFYVNHTLRGPLGIPSFAVGGYRYILNGELPHGIGEKDLLKVT
ncbi:MAG: hypothetical protein ACREHD_02245, partial [Pirellulales bacterium]